MSQDLALKKSTKNMPEHSFLTLLDNIKEAAANVIPHEQSYDIDDIIKSGDTLQESFGKDYKRLEELSELLFSDETTAYGDRCTAVFERWEKEGGGPSLLTLLAMAWDKFSFPKDGNDPLAKCAVMAAIMGEVPNKLQYHGNEHYRKVLFHTIRMIAVQRGLACAKNRLENDNDARLLMIAAAIHDLGHEGGDNLRDGIYTPGYMEQKAYDMVAPYFEALGMDHDQLKTLQTLIFTTDITFFAGDNSPCVRMRRIYDYFFHDNSNEEVLNYIIGKLRLFDDNPKLALMAMMLHEADIATSAGLSYEQSIKETIDIIEERDMKTAGPRVLLAFLQEQLEGGMKTESARILFSSAMETIMAQARADFQSGRETFYD